MIRKAKRGFTLLSRRRGRKGKRRILGTYPTRAGAQRREKQVKTLKWLRKAGRLKAQ